MRLLLVGLCACSFSTGVPQEQPANDAPPVLDTGLVIGSEAGGCPSTPITCPMGYVFVANNCDFGAGDFCIMKFEAKVSGGIARSAASGTPTGNITTIAAKAACV